MDRTLIQNLKIEMHKDDVMQYLGRRAAKLDVESLLEAANAVANPKFIVKEVSCECKDGLVFVGDMKFESPELASLLEGQNKVLLYVATAGNEIIENANIENSSIKDLLTTALFAYSKKVVGEYLKKTIGGTNWTELKPGVVSDWPVSANIEICRAIGNIEEIGVSINDAGYLSPINSNAGILIHK